MTNLIFLLVCLSIANAAEVAEEAKATRVPPANSQSESCIEVTPENGKHLTKKDFPTSISDFELVKRLVYAETVAANCPPVADEMIAAIAQVILNRVRVFTEKGYSDPYRRTVFGKSQFASSLHTYKHARLRSFLLCEKDDKLYKRVSDVVDKVKNGTLGTPQLKQGTHYYLHQHFGTYKEHPWGKSALPLYRSNNCLTVYKVDLGYLASPF